MSLEGAYDDQNTFAKIVRGAAPATVIAETDATLAFMDVFPQSRGHCLVIPKAGGARNLFDVDPATLGAVTAEVQRIARAVRDGLKPDGVRIAQFNGEPAGQTVFHLHFHIIPIYADEALGAHASGGPAGADVLEPLAEKIRAAL
ncbi:MAG: HIT family protein [Pseudomonadota bacterium]